MSYNELKQKYINELQIKSMFIDENSRHFFSRKSNFGIHWFGLVEPYYDNYRINGDGHQTLLPRKGESLFYLVCISKTGRTHIISRANFQEIRET